MDVIPSNTFKGPHIALYSPLKGPIDPYIGFWGALYSLLKLLKGPYAALHECLKDPR